MKTGRQVNCLDRAVNYDRGECQRTIGVVCVRVRVRVQPGV